MPFLRNFSLARFSRVKKNAAAPLPGRSPRSCLPPLLRAMAGGRGEREKNYSEDDVTQGGARSSLALGHYNAIPTEYQFGSLFSREEELGGPSPRPLSPLLPPAAAPSDGGRARGEGEKLFRGRRNPGRRSFLAGPGPL